MARASKVPKQAPQAPPPPNMGAVNDILAKARALVGSIKRPNSSTLAGQPVAVKAKASGDTPSPEATVAVVQPPAKAPAPPATLHPPTRVRGKSTVEPSHAAPKALPPPPSKAVGTVPSAVSPSDVSQLTPAQRTQAYLKSVKQARMQQEGADLKTPPPKKPAPSPESNTTTTTSRSYR